MTGPIYALGDDRPEFPEDGDFWIAPDASVIGRVRLASQVSIWFGAVLRGDNEWIEIGSRSNIQDRSVLHTDWGSPLTIGSNVTVGHSVVLHGCTIGDYSLVGIGSVIMNDARIGRHCLIGSNTLVTSGKQIPDGSLVMGSPAKIIRDVTDEERELLSASAEVYVNNWQRFRHDLVALDGQR